MVEALEDRTVLVPPTAIPGTSSQADAAMAHSSASIPSQGDGVQMAAALPGAPPTGPGQSAYGAGVSPHVVISEVYGGGNVGVPVNRDFVELFNRGDRPVNLSGWSLQYAAPTSNVWQVTPLSGSIAPGQYFLIGGATGTSGTPLPAPDVSGTFDISELGGKVAVVRDTQPLSDEGAAFEYYIVDCVGYGPADYYEGTAPAVPMSPGVSLQRGNGGYVDTGENATDFALASPSPQNTSTFHSAHVNMPPNVSMPDPQNTLRDTPLVFTESALNDIWVYDADAAGHSIQVTLGVSTGTATLSGVIGLTFTTGDGTADAMMMFTGKVDDINAALEGLTYTPPAGFIGTAGLGLMVNDQGNTGSGGPRTAQGQVSIGVGTLAVVTVTAADANASEAGADTGRLTFTRSGGEPYAGLPVFYDISGTASHGDDYQALTGMVCFAPNVTAVDVLITPLDDLLVEGPQDVTATLQPGGGFILGSSWKASVIIQDDDATSGVPVVTVTASDPSSSEPGVDDPGRLTFTRNGGDVSGLLTVSYALSGNAANGTDYQSLPGSVTFSPGETKVNVWVTPQDDALAEGPEAVIVTAQAGAGYAVGSEDSAAVIVEDNEAPGGGGGGLTVQFQVAASQGLESVTPALLRVDLSAAVPPGQMVTVEYKVTGGTATRGPDYVLADGTLTFHMGDTIKFIHLTTINDTIQETYETAMVTLSNPMGGTLGVRKVHTFTIVDDEGGLIKAKTPQGANYAEAHAAQTLFGHLVPPILGAGVPVGVIEAPTPDGKIGADPAKMHLGGRVKQDQDFGTATLPVGADQPAAKKDGKHAAFVADVIASNDPYYKGVAPSADVYLATIAYEQTEWLGMRGAIDWYYSRYGVKIFNHSYGGGPPGSLNDNGKNVGARFLDWFSQRYDILNVVIAHNYGNEPAPHTAQISNLGDQLNGITVGAVDESFTSRADYSSYRLKGDGPKFLDERGKPDILAYGGSLPPGIQDSNGYLLGSGTSVAAPLVTGTAALLADPALPNHLTFGAGNAHLAAKAIILNSARKRFVNGPESTFPLSRDNAKTDNEFSDANYLSQLGGLLRANTSTGTTGADGLTPFWTPTEWSTDADGNLTVKKPLDDEQGTGVLDTERALIQHQAGQQGPGNVSKIGWDVNEASPQRGGAKAYKINGPLTEGQFLTVTLCWDRILDEIEDDGTPGDNKVEATDNYDPHPAGANDLGTLPDFNLYVFKGDRLVARSLAEGGRGGDNVEHLHFPVPEDGNDYRIEVWFGSGAKVTKTYPYALAWWGPQ